MNDCPKVVARECPSGATHSGGAGRFPTLDEQLLWKFNSPTRLNRSAKVGERTASTILVSIGETERGAEEIEKDFIRSKAARSIIKETRIQTHRAIITNGILKMTRQQRLADAWLTQYQYRSPRPFEGPPVLGQENV